MMSLNRVEEVMATVKRKKSLEQEIRDSAALKFEELARAQGVGPVTDFTALLGGWPEEERNDGFEEAVARWRQEGLSSRDDE
jgi:hypothetical protein